MKVLSIGMMMTSERIVKLVVIIQCYSVLVVVVVTRSIIVRRDDQWPSDCIDIGIGVWKHWYLNVIIQWSIVQLLMTLVLLTVFWPIIGIDIRVLILIIVEVFQ